MVQPEEKHAALQRRSMAANIAASLWQPAHKGSQTAGQAARYSHLDRGFVGTKPSPANTKAALESIGGEPAPTLTRTPAQAEDSIQRAAVQAFELSFGLAGKCLKTKMCSVIKQHFLAALNEHVTAPEADYGNL